MKRVETVNQKATVVGKINEFIESHWYKEPAPLHNFYFEKFNAVDIGDGYFYACDEKHPNHFWKSKMFMSIMRLGVLNVWILYSECEYMQWMDFRENLANFLSEYQ